VLDAVIQPAAILMPYTSTSSHCRAAWRRRCHRQP